MKSEERCTSCIYPEEIFKRHYAPKCEECFFIVRKAKELIARCVKCRNQYDAQRIENNPIDSRQIEIKVGRALECVNYYYRIIRIEDDKLFLSTINKHTGIHGATEIVTKESLMNDLKAEKIHLLERPPKEVLR